MIRVCAISDLHGVLPEIRECDVVFICGDTFPLEIQRINTECEAWFLSVFRDWVIGLPCKKVYFIAGNHCFWLERMGYKKICELIEKTEGLKDKLIYLQDNLVEIEPGITVYGCPWCEGPRGWAFIDEFGTRYDKIPDCDILLTHQPPDVGGVGCSYPGTAWEKNFGSDILRGVIRARNIRYNFCGHIHSGTHGGVGFLKRDTIVYNVSIKDEDYNVAYEPLYLTIKRAPRKPTNEEWGIISKTLDIVHQYYVEHEEEFKKKHPDSDTASEMESQLFDDYIEYDNGFGEYLCHVIERKWDSGEE